jgi:hypothetical protein
MKRFTAILLTTFILISNLGLAFNIHYCHNEIASVSLSFEQEESCNENPNSCCASSDNHKKCCSETTIKTDKKSDDILVKSFQLDLQQFVANTQHWDFNFSKEIVSIKKNNLIENYSESNSPPLYKLYCQLVLYA